MCHQPTSCLEAMPRLPAMAFALQLQGSALHPCHMLHEPLQPLPAVLALQLQGPHCWQAVALPPSSLWAGGCSLGSNSPTLCKLVCLLTACYADGLLSLLLHSPRYNTLRLYESIAASADPLRCVGCPAAMRLLTCLFSNSITSFPGLWLPTMWWVP